MNSFKRFLKDETGAVTVDWVVLTAGVVVLAVVVMPPIQTAVVEMAVMIGEQVGIAGTWLDGAQD
jgi:Flp pilus assembly pilin Flp